MEYHLEEHMLDY